MDLLSENLSEKTSTSFKIVSMPKIPEHQFFVEYKDFEKSIFAIMFGSFLLLCMLFFL